MHRERSAALTSACVTVACAAGLLALPGCDAATLRELDIPDAGEADGGRMKPDAGAPDGGRMKPDAGPNGAPRVAPITQLDSDVGRYSAAIAVLPSGRVLVAGGLIVRMSFGTGQEAAEEYDLTSHTITAVGDLREGRSGAAATALPDGKVLITGGAGGPAGEQGLRRDTAELYDPSTRTFTLLSARLVEARAGHGAHLIEAGPHAGKVLLVGGDEPPLSAELYDPGTQTFSALPNDGAPAGRESRHTLLADGRVFVSGVRDSQDAAIDNYVYDPVAGTWRKTANFATARLHHAAARLPDGRVLVTGGAPDGSSAPLASAVVWDPNTDSFTDVGPMASARRFHGMAALGSGRVAVAGGQDGSAHLASVEIYDPDTERFTPAEGMLGLGRSAPSVFSLPDGRVVVLGGQGGRLSLIVATVDIVTE